MEAIKEQIRIRILGFGWDDLHIAWSNNSIQKSPEQLLDYLNNTLIPAQTSRGVPETPKITLPSRQDNMPTLGTRTTDIAVLDKKQKDQSDSFVIAAVAKRDQLERDGMHCRYKTQQSNEPPKQDAEFIGTHIEQLWNFTENDGSTERIWCKLKVQ